MLGFIIPVKPKQYSKDWKLDNMLLERTIKSICNQDDQNFKLIIVYTDMPRVSFLNDHIHCLHFPFPEVKVTGIHDWDDMQKWYTPEFGERMMDKARKIIFGCKVAKSFGCTFLISIDSDDLVSRRISSFVNQQAVNNCAGWRITKGYVYEENSAVAIKNRKIWAMNGSTHIIRADLVKIPDFHTNLNLFDYTLFQSHAYTYQRLIDYQQQKLESIPFYAVIYIIHANNYSKVREIVNANSIKLAFKKILLGRIVTRKMRDEFGLYPIEKIFLN